MDDYFMPFFIVIFVSMMSFLLLMSSFFYSEVDGVVRDKYVSNSTQYLLVDYSTGETKSWDVRPQYYETCEIGNKIHRNTDGSLDCSE